MNVATAHMPQDLFGRQQELERLSEWILAGPAVVQIYGAPGSGKTHLLRALGRDLEQRGLPVSWLNAALVRPDSEVVRAFLEQLPDSSEGDAAVLIIDDFDLHVSLHPMYWRRFLPELCPNTRVVLASAHPLAAAHAPSQGHSLSAIPLRPFDPEVSDAYLAHKGVPETRRPSLVQWTGGMPLLLATLSEFGNDRDAGPTQAPLDPQRALWGALGTVLREAPSDEHRQALWASSLPLVLSERLLAGMLDHPRSNECFRWLRTRPYVERTAKGLMIHHSFREPLLDSLMQQAPLLYRDFLIRAGHFHIARATDRNARDRVGAATDHFYTQRRQYPLSLHREALSRSRLYADTARTGSEAECERLDHLVAEQLGPASVSMGRHWRMRQPDQLRVLRDADGEVQGLVQAVRINVTTREDARTDPAMAAAQRVLLERDGERRRARPHGRQRARRQPALLFRLYAGARLADGDEVARAEIIEHMLMTTIAQARASLVLLATSTRAGSSDASTAEALVRAGLAKTFQDGRFVLSGEPFAIIGHDFMDGSLAHWLRHALATIVSGTRSPGRPNRTILLDRTEFDHAVRDALEGYFDERMLAQSPLVDALASYDEQLPAERRIKSWLRDGLSQLARMPGGEAYANQLRDRYFDRVGSPERDSASDHLMAAIQLLIATLWDAHVARLSPA